MTRLVKSAEVRRQEIISASKGLFLKQGYENTSMENVMAEVKIAKGTIYHYFKCKETLLDAVVEEMVTEYMARVEDSLDGFEGSAMEKLQVLILAGKVSGEDSVNMLENLHLPGNMGMHVRLLGHTLSKLAPLYARIISQGVQEGVFETECPLECAETLLAGIQFITDRGCYPWSESDMERRRIAIPCLMEDLLHAPKKSFAFLLQ